MLSSVDMTVDPLLTVEYQCNPWVLKDMGNILFSTALRGALNRVVGTGSCRIVLWGGAFSRVIVTVAKYRAFTHSSGKSRQFT